MKQSFLYGLVFGLFEGGILLFWCIEGVQRYTGGTTLLGIPLFLAAVGYMSIFPAVFGVIYSYSVKNKNRPVYLRAIIAGAIWIILEWINVNTLPGVPWVKYSLAFCQSKNLIGLQLAGVTGQWGLSFFTVVTNLLLAEALRVKRFGVMWGGIGTVSIFYLLGAIVLAFPDAGECKRVKAAILQENIKAETRWQESTGDTLANIFFDLNRQAAEMKPDIIIWSETALPWTFAVDDHLVTKALQLTRKSQAGHVLGMLHQVGEQPDRVHNSVFYIEPDGRITNRYDKVELLSFIEKPMFNSRYQIPLLSQSIHNNVLSGKKMTLLETRHGKIGILICNESLLPYRAREAVEHGADYLVNISNDAWLEDTQLVDHHFYYARMRAVETGRSVIANSNRGYAGIVDGKGRICEMHLSTRPACMGSVVDIRMNRSLYVKFGDWLIYMAILLISVHISRISIAGHFNDLNISRKTTGK